jgi:hypothetical protein
MEDSFKSTKLVLLGSTAALDLPTTESDMAYVAFEICTVPVGGLQKRGVKAKCGYCDRTESFHVNTAKSHGNDDDTQERNIAIKFEKLGWKIGKTATQHRCPSCFAALKSANARRSKENGTVDNKVVHINPPVPMDPVSLVVAVEPTESRRPTREERRIIYNAIDPKYVNETSGYSAGWDDKKIAIDLGVPVEWVAEIRDENFGPNTNEVTVALLTDAKNLLEEFRATKYTAEPIIAALKALDDRAQKIEQLLIAIVEKK